MTTPTDAGKKPGPPPKGTRRAAPKSDGDTAPKPETNGDGPRLGEGTPFEKAFTTDRPPPKKDRDTVLYSGLTEFYTQIGTFVTAIDPQCGMAIVQQATTCADSMEKLARENAAVKRALKKLIEGSAMGAVIMAHAPIAFAIALHHVPALQERMAMMTMGMPVPDPTGFPG